MPLHRWHWRATCSCRVTQMMGQRGRYLASRCAVKPVVVRAMIAEASHLNAASTAAMATVCVESDGVST